MVQGSKNTSEADDEDLVSIVEVLHVPEASSTVDHEEWESFRAPAENPQADSSREHLRSHGSRRSPATNGSLLVPNYISQNSQRQVR